VTNDSHVSVPVHALMIGYWALPAVQLSSIPLQRMRRGKERRKERGHPDLETLTRPVLYRELPDAQYSSQY